MVEPRITYWSGGVPFGISSGPYQEIKWSERPSEPPSQEHPKRRLPFLKAKKSEDPVPVPAA